MHAREFVQTAPRGRIDASSFLRLGRYFDQALMAISNVGALTAWAAARTRPRTLMGEMAGTPADPIV